MRTWVGFYLPKQCLPRLPPQRVLVFKDSLSTIDILSLLSILRIENHTPAMVQRDTDTFYLDSFPLFLFKRNTTTRVLMTNTTSKPGVSRGG